MKRAIVVLIMIVALLMMVNCEKSTTSTAAKNTEKELTLDTEQDKSSYAVGYSFGTRVRAIASGVDIDIVSQGFMDATQGKTIIPESQLKEIYSNFQKKLLQKHKRELETLAQQNKIRGEQFLAQNAAKEGVIVTKSGLQYMVLREGTGPAPRETDIVVVHYRGAGIDGQEILNTYANGHPAKLPLPRSLPAWKEGLRLMKVGAKFVFFIPPELAYGKDGYKNAVAPNTTLIYEVELLGIEPPYIPPKTNRKKIEK
jgi:FKBP-type peptidyl-prolyl cis-trans isomerase